MPSLIRSLVFAALGALAGCDLVYPEVAVVNRTSQQIQLRGLSFNGCVWETVLSFGETTSVGRCLPGEDRVHFEKLDTLTANPTPIWFNYQTVSVRRADYGEFHAFEVRLDDMEQDFSVPGPYGH